MQNSSPLHKPTMCSIALPADVVTPPRSALARNRGGCRLRLAAGVTATSPSSTPQPKKKVVFADARGLNLTEIRWLTETPTEPPRWSSSFINQCGSGTPQLTRRLTITTEVEQVTPEPPLTWEIQFVQPNSLYFALQRKIQQDMIALERCGIDQRNGNITGSIKVRNLAYEKEVCIRWTSDLWKTSHDEVCEYQKPFYMHIGRNNSPIVCYYDTFTFSIHPPDDAKRVEFALRYTCSGKEYWDNFGELNYALTRPEKKQIKQEKEVSNNAGLPYW